MTRGEFMRRNRFTCLGFILAFMLFLPCVFAADCTLDSNTMDRGERKAFIICGADIPTRYVLKGLSEANIRIEYEQYLKMCGIGLTNPGLYLILKAEDNANTASLSILNAETNGIVCKGLTIEVPDRIHVKEAALEDPRESNLPLKILTIKAGKSQDLSQAGTGGLSFPRGKWPSLSLLSGEEMKEIPAKLKESHSIKQPLTCSKSSIQAVVKVQGQQRYPAKIIISKVKLENGQEKEGVAYVNLPSPAWASAMRDEDAKFVDVNGIRTRYFEKGRGDALLLVHGGQAGETSNAHNWEQNFDELSRYFHVYVIDRLGQGHTGNPKTDRDYEEYYQRVVDHVYGFMKAVGIGKVHLVGQSQGGWPVTRIALDHPEMVKSLVNMDSVMAPDDPLGRSMPFMMYVMFFVNPDEGTSPESIRREMELWSYSMNNITDTKVKDSYTATHLPKRNEARGQMIKHRMNPAHPSFLALKKKAHEEIKAGKLKVPSLVIWGYNDPSMTYEVGIELFKLMSTSNPRSQLHLFNNCGHSPYIEYPEEFNRLIKDFCGRYATVPIE